MRLIAAILCTLVLISAFPACAADYPAPQGAATDLADVLSSDTISDLTALSKRYESATGGEMYVMTRHFLGGADVYEYAKELFKAWKLKKDDALLLLVIGEESYALCLGEKAAEALPAESRSVMLGNYFREKFLARDYDGAVGDLAARLAVYLAKARGEELSVSGLFGSAAPAESAFSAGIVADLFDNLFSTGYETANDAQTQEDAFAKEDEKTGFSYKRLIIFALIIYFIFFRKKRRRFDFSRRR